MDYRYEGIIIGKRNVGEADRIYDIYTLEIGRTSVLGKGTRKQGAKLAGFLEPITYAQIFIARSRGLGKITGVETLENFPAVKNDAGFLEKVFYSFRALKKIIPEGEKDESVFRMLKEYLFALEEMGEFSEQPAEILTLGFLFKLLDAAGYRTETGECVFCRRRLRPEGNFFDAARGGIICRECSGNSREKMKIGEGAIKMLRIFLKNKIGNLTKIRSSEKDLREARMAVERTLKWIAG